LRRNGIARAVRLALATSASLLALAGAAQAGTCLPAVPTTGDTVECDGIFAGTIAYAVDDLTLVVGSNDPATAVTTVGSDGISLDDNVGGTLSLFNYGDVTSDMANVYGVNAIDVRADGDVYVLNAGDVVLLGDGETYAAPNYYATAIVAYSDYGDAVVVNGATGSIYSHTDNLVAYAIVARGFNGAASAVNHGDLDVSSDNNIAVGMLAIGETGDAYVGNTGNIVVSGGGPLRSAGGFALAYVGDATVSNSGDIAVVTSASNAQGMAAVANNGYAFAYNAGSISADGALASFGLVAVGVDAGLDNRGSVITTGSQDATALRARATLGYALLDNSGDAVAVAGDGYAAFGISVASAYGSEAYNSGSASGEVAGATGSAIGVYLLSNYGDAYLRNDGDVSASGGAYAIGLDMLAYGNGLLVNYGSISAANGAVASLAVRSGASDDLLENHGDLTGGLATGDGDDLLLNLPGASWSAGGNSDFGDGDDGVANGGTINLSDAFIDLGAATTGNYFDNQGTLTVDGAANRIDMGGAYAFGNAGLIDFHDGAADDVLRIAGDFAGDGHLLVDVSGLDNSADLLYVEGDVAPTAANIVDVALLDLPADGSSLDIPLVYVAGDSTAGNFNLGTVSYAAAGLLDFDFSLVPSIDASNATDDVWSLRTELLGLGETGAIAAALAPGVQVLMQSVVGRLAQRNAVLGDAPPGRFSAWARVYRNRGTINPGGGDNLAFDQRNSGGETGFDFAGSKKFSVGLLLGKAGADQSLASGGADSKVEGDIKGAFGTMRLPRGVYADLSHRKLTFDVEMQTPNGPLRTSGVAETTNAETGYKWKSKNGLVLEGQYQTMRTRLVSVGPIGTGAQFASKPDLSTITRLGLSATKYFKPGPTGTLWEVHANANLIREFHARNEFLIADAVEGSTDLGGTSSMLEIGFTGRRGLLLMFGGITWQDGGPLQNFIGGALGAKYTW
jgi:hypothetical protein